MIRAIAAIDNKRGMATDTGIPWKLPSDGERFTTLTQDGIILMGYGTYKELTKPLHDKPNYVVTRDADEKLRDGFVPVVDTDKFFVTHDDIIWDIGGPGLLAATIDHIDELYLTQIDSDFNCTKFFPEYENDFTRQSVSDEKTENGISFRFEIWHRKTDSPALQIVPPLV